MVQVSVAAYILFQDSCTWSTHTDVHAQNVLHVGVLLHDGNQVSFFNRCVGEWLCSAHVDTAERNDLA